MTSLAFCRCRCADGHTGLKKENWPHMRGVTNSLDVSTQNLFHFSLCERAIVVTQSLKTWINFDYCQTHLATAALTLTVFVLTGILHGAGLWQLPKQLYLPTEEKSALAPNSHLKYVWYDPAAAHCSCQLRLYFCPVLPWSGDICSRLYFFALLGFSPGSAVLFLPLSSHHFCCFVFKKMLEGSLPTPTPQKKKEGLEGCLTLIPHMVASLPCLVLIQPC